jgi:hypothetical protein
MGFLSSRVAKLCRLQRGNIPINAGRRQWIVFQFFFNSSSTDKGLKTHELQSLLQEKSLTDFAVTVTLRVVVSRAQPGFDIAQALVWPLRSGLAVR